MGPFIPSSEAGQASKLAPLFHAGSDIPLHWRNKDMNGDVGEE